MSNDYSNFVAGLTEAIIGGLFGILLTCLAIRLQEKRQIVEYDIFSMPLLRFKPAPERPIIVSVDKSLLNTEGLGKGELVQVDSAYGFEIEIQNSGTHPIEKCVIEITLDEDAKIIEYGIQPSSKPGRIINTQKDEHKLNVLRISPEYLNKKEKIQVRITSTGNTSQKCEIGVLGLGLQVRERSLLRTLFPLMLGMVIVLLIFGLFLDVSPSNPIGQRIIEVFNLKIKQESRIDYPWWVFIIYTLIFLPMYFITVREFIKSKRRNKSWGSGFEKEKSTFKEFLDFFLS